MAPNIYKEAQRSNSDTSSASTLHRRIHEHNEPALHHLDAFKETTSSHQISPKSANHPTGSIHHLEANPRRLDAINDASIHSITANSPKSVNPACYIHHKEVIVRHDNPIDDDAASTHIMENSPTSATHPRRENTINNFSRHYNTVLNSPRSAIHPTDANANPRRLDAINDASIRTATANHPTGYIHQMKANARHENIINDAPSNIMESSPKSATHLIGDFHHMDAKARYVDTIDVDTSIRRTAENSPNSANQSTRYIHQMKGNTRHENAIGGDALTHSMANSPKSANHPRHENTIDNVSTHYNTMLNSPKSATHPTDANTNPLTHKTMADHLAVPDFGLPKANAKKHGDHGEEILTRQILTNLAALSEGDTLRGDEKHAPSSRPALSDIHWLHAADDKAPVGEKSTSRPSRCDRQLSDHLADNLHKGPIRKKSAHHFLENRRAISDKHLETNRNWGAACAAASHAIATKILCPTDGDETGALERHDPVTELTGSVSEILAPAYTKVSGAAYSLASKMQNSSGTTNNHESSGHKSLAKTVSEMVTPAYNMVSDMSSKIATKIQRGATSEEEIGAKLAHDNAPAWDKGPSSVKEYLIQKLEPGHDERALSEVITEAVSPKKGEGRIGVMEKVRGKVASLMMMRKEEGINAQIEPTAKISSGPILPVSTNPRAVEVEERGGRKLQAYAN